MLHVYDQPRTRSFSQLLLTSPLWPSIPIWFNPLFFSDGMWFGCQLFFLHLPLYHGADDPDNNNHLELLRWTPRYSRLILLQPFRILRLHFYISTPSHISSEILSSHRLHFDASWYYFQQASMHRACSVSRTHFSMSLSPFFMDFQDCDQGVPLNKSDCEEESSNCHTVLVSTCLDLILFHAALPLVNVSEWL